MEAKKESLVAKLKKLHRKNAGAIKARLYEFSVVGKESERRVLAELCFCLCTPQTKAKAAWYNAVLPLMECGRLYSCEREELEGFLKNTGVRFHRTKAGNIIEARKKFAKKGVKETVAGCCDPQELRNRLAEEVRGLGMKEASHFLRNIGLGRDLAILDRHILRNLVLLGVIEKIPKSLTKKKYLEIEDRMREFSKEIRIPMDELDMLLWMKETGEVFK
jgi:N-glycosylase/DNA lyase